MIHYRKERFFSYDVFCFRFTPLCLQIDVLLELQAVDRGHISSEIYCHIYSNVMLHESIRSVFGKV